MSKYSLKKFQLKAKERFEKILEDLEYTETLKELSKNPANHEAQKQANHGKNDAFSIQIDAPTGSGKTVLLGHVAKDNFDDYVHIVFSPGAGNLEEQTAKRLGSILGNTNITLVNETTFSQPAATGMTYVGNWEQFVSRDAKTGAYKNRTVREGDNKNMFDWIVEMGSKYTPIVITIDEAHYGSSKGLNSIKRFLEDIQQHLGYSPLYVEVSATHVIEAARKVKVDLQDVIDEGLIRKAVRLNDKDLLTKIDKLSPEQRASYQIEPFLLDFALEKQLRIDAEYIKVDAHEMINGKKVYYHSLIGVQIPNGTVGNEAIQRIETRLRDEHNITRENGLLAVFLSDDKTTNMKDIDSPSSAVRVLVYKQGVATGWDCPRAQILLGYRHITSKIFTKQNLGRFLRTTQAKHYGNDLLDSAYVISNVGDLGQTSFGDDLDKDVTYEKEAVYRVSKDGHFALSSFNEKNIVQNHYGFVNQTLVSPADLRKAWNAAAKAKQLWKNLEYSYITSSDEGLVSGIAATSDVYTKDGNYSLEGTSKKLAVNNEQQMKDFQDKVLETLLFDEKNYGNNSQIARALSNLIIRWYREAVLKETSSTHEHYGKLRSVITHIDSETKEGLRYGEPDWFDIAVEQISLDSFHWTSVSQVISKALESIQSIRVVDDEEFENKGAPWAERALINDDTFSIKVNEAKWLSEKPENKLSHGMKKFYATTMVVSDESYREGGALASGPELSFEKSAIPSLIATEGTSLSSYYKSPENKNGSFRIGVKTANDSVSSFYPDYLGELKNAEGEYLPWVIEVKSYEDILSANGDMDSILNAKAKALVDMASQYSIKAGIAYEDKNRDQWVVITSVSDEGKFTTSPFRIYILN